MGKAGLQFLLLLWKNYVLQKRKVIVTVVEIALPALFSLILIFIRQKVKTENFSEGKNYTPYNIEHFPSNLCPERPQCLFASPWQLYYTPDDPYVTKIMNTLMKNLNNEIYKVKAYKSEDAMVADILANFQGTNVNDSSNHVSDILGGIVFESFPNNMTVLKSSQDIKYKIRLRYSWSGTSGSISEIFSQEQNKWNTKFMYPVFQIIGPRNKDSNAGGPPAYYYDGFLTLQYQLDLAILQAVNSSSAGHLSPSSLRMRRFPYPPWIHDPFVLVLQQQLPLLLLLSFIFSALHMVKDVVHEKERKLKETLKMMGISSWLHWSAWLLKYFVFLLVSVCLMTVLLCVPASSRGRVVGYTAPSILFLFLLAYALSTISFSFMVSVFFSKANSGAAAGGVLFFMTYIPYSFLQPRYSQLSWGAKIASCLISNTAMSFGGQVIGMFEGTGKGVQWSNLNSGVTVDDSFTMLHVILMLLFDSFLYGLVTWYVEAVFPGEYGVPRVWYFPVQPSYWCGTKPVKEVEMDETTPLLTSRGHSQYFEADPVGLQPGIKMNQLRKVYKSASGPAVHGTTLSMYEGQITALLGHNGAGKTTTISMLTGFIPATSGSALVNGYDITEDIESVRESIGLCPQHDVLFDNLTVEEHLWFFAKLKGVPSESVEQEIERYLTVMGLGHKAHARSKTLSGGQKRKLSVGIALIGDSKIVILDEPSSGMDPNARRQTWEILQQNKNGRTVILTTHHMDEADVLGDRIAIMAGGVVKCCGTSLFLKNKYGAGYHLVIVKLPDCDVDRITELIQKHVPTMQLESNISMEVRYRLPYESKAAFELLFSELESNMTQLSVTSFGVSVTTMEEVFLKVGEDATDTMVTGDHGSISDQSQSSNPSGLTPSVNNSLQNNLTVTRKHGGLLLYVQQFCAMFIKRALYTRRNLVVTVAQLLVPLVFTLLGLIVIKTIPDPDDSPELTLTMSHFDGNQVLYTNSTGQAGSLSHIYSSQFNMYPKVHTHLVNGDMENILIRVGKSDLAEYNENYLIASSFINEGPDVDSTVWFNNQAYHTPAISLGAVMNTWLQYLTGSNLTISTVNHPLPRSLQQTINDQLLLSFEGFTVAFNVLFGMSFLVSSFTLFLIKERATKAKHVQFVSGVHSATFWLSTMCWDFVNFLVPAATLLILFVAFGIEAYTGDGRLGYIALLFFLFGWAVLPFIYLLSFIFSVPSSGLVWLTMFNILSGVTTVLAVDILNIPQLNTTEVAHSLEWTFLTVLPHFCLGQGLQDFYENYQFLQICDQKEVQAFCTLGFTNPCCKDNCGDFCLYTQENFLSWGQGGIGRMLTFLSAQGVVYFLLLLLIESELLKVLWYKIQDLVRGRIGRLNHHSEAPIVQEDSDVAIERQRIATTSVETLCGLDMLVMTELTKYYGNLLAVESLSVGIPQGECFGLLGVNGAGKTSTFKMLTGDEMVTSGEAYLAGFNVKKNIKQVQQRVGYCPQFDALIDHMTGRETLTMFARLRGVNECDIKHVVSTLLKELLLEEHASKLVKAYSGGNKRKLSTAIALVGSPPIIFLDEPSTGMDPVARRQLWDTLARVRAQGSTLVLTSHSMEECEALCTRIAIMVNGQFKCLGSPQHLKNKFGEGYTLIAKVRYPITEDSGASAQPNTQAFISFIQATFPASILKDVHQGMLHFHITAPNVTWSQLFSVLEKSREKYDLEDYSISQTTLEQVFINFARAQIPPQEVTRTCCTRLTSCLNTWCCFCCSGYYCGRCPLLPCGSHDPEELLVLPDEEENERA